MYRLSRRAVLGSGGALLFAGSAGQALQEPRADAIIHLDRNESPFGPAPQVASALENLVSRAARYPYREIGALRALIATREGVPADCVYVSEGSAELLKLAALIYGGPGRQILASRPTFPMLPEYAERRGAHVVWVDIGRDHRLPFEDMQARVGDDTALIYVCNPNNPTGTLAHPEDLRRFIQVTSKRALVVVDEAYIDFAAGESHLSMLDRVKAGDNVLVTRSFSKLYGLAGLRIGYGVGSADLIRRFESLRISFPNVAGVLAATVSLGDSAFIRRVREQTMQSKQRMYGVFDELAWPYAPSESNFIMVDAGATRPGFFDFARRAGVMVAPVSAPFASWIRVSMGTAQELQRFARVARAFGAGADSGG